MRSICLPALLLVTAAFAAPKTLDYTYFVSRLTALDALPAYVPGMKCAQASSYDRASKYDAATDTYVNWDANGDCGQYIRLDKATGEAVMADLKGPGCVFRIWSANPQGKIRFYIDGATKPSYEFEFKDLFLGKYPPFEAPLVWARDGGGRASDCFLPIPYAKSLLVTADKKYNQYYHIGYQTYVPGTNVQSFHLPLTAKETAALNKVKDAWSHCGDLSGHTLTTTKMVSLSGVMGLELGKGPGTIRALTIKQVSGPDPAKRGIGVRMFFDGEKTPFVDAPLAELFGESFGQPEYRSLPLGVTKDGGYCLYPMPFRRQAVIEIVNYSGERTELQIGVDIDKRPVPKDAMYFHAKFRREKECAVFEYPFLEATGKGKMVGVALFVDNVHGGWWGEGDEKSYVDGEKFPSMFGTGSEDYFGDAWGIQYFVNPTHGCPSGELRDFRKESCYRWHIADCIQFDTSLKFTIENYSRNDAVKNDYASMTYWYQTPGGSDFFKPMTAEELAPR